jgi:hypothetical protein
VSLIELNDDDKLSMFEVIPDVVVATLELNAPILEETDELNVE